MKNEILDENILEMFEYLVTNAGLSWEAAITALDLLGYDVNNSHLKEIYKGNK